MFQMVDQKLNNKLKVLYHIYKKVKLAEILYSPHKLWNLSLYFLLDKLHIDVLNRFQ